MIRYTKIHGFDRAVRHAHRNRERFEGKRVRFEGTVKLHGTNAGVRVGPARMPGAYHAQSRNRTLTLEHDNAGFAAFALDPERRTFLTYLAHYVGAVNGATHTDEVVLFGEWCGPGIQKGVALNMIAERQFVLFAAAIGSADRHRYVELPEPGYCRSPSLQIRSVYDGPVDYITVDLLDPASVARAAEKLNVRTAMADKICPWTETVFGIQGVGEGWVWRPVGPSDLRDDPDLLFKVKGPSHGERGAAKKARATPQNVEGVARFVAFAVTPERCRQAIEFLEEHGHPLNMRSTGAFLKRIAEDVRAECSDELALAGLVWKDVHRAVGQVALVEWKKVAR